ncbi:MAG: ATP-binding cassette domain-containing protein [Bacilli bacterium]
MLIAKNLDKNYGNQKVIENFSYFFPQRGIISIIGPSGVGKSTLLYLLAGMEKLDRGQIFYQEEEISAYSPKERIAYHRHHLSMVFQNDYLFASLTVEENLIIALKIRGYSSRKSQQLIKRYLKEFQLEYLRKQKVDTLSGGEKSRIGLIRALMHEPAMLFADEPTGALDEKSALKVLEILKRFAEKSLVIIVTHSEKLAHAYSDQIIDLNQPHLYQNYAPTSIIRSEKKIIQSRDLSLTSLLLRTRLFKSSVTALLNVGSLSLGVFSALITLGFHHGTKLFMESLPYQYLDMNTALIQEVRKEKMYNSPLVLNKLSPPSREIQAQIKEYYPEVSFHFNYDNVINKRLQISYGGVSLSELEVVTIDRWQHSKFKEDLIVEGCLPTLDEAVTINYQAKEYIYKQTREEGLNKFLDFHLLFSIENIHPNDENQKIVDNLERDFSLEIFGIVEEASVLTTPKIFISQTYLETLGEVMMENWSMAHERTITWNDYWRNTSAPSLSDYAIRIIFPDHYIGQIFHQLHQYPLDELTSLDFKNAGARGYGSFQSLYNFLKIAFNCFVIIGLTGVLAMIIIITFAKLVTNKKNLAILRSLGASNAQLKDYFLADNILQFFLSLSILGITPILLSFLNPLLKNLTGIKEAIVIPLHVLGINYGLPILLLVCGVMVLTFVISMTFQYFSKQIILKELISE